MELTLETLEALAEQVEQDEEAHREKLARMIRAYARILAARAPDTFRARALEYSDEEGHYDNSYPPKQQYKDRNGPRLYCVRKFGWESIATEGGFYYHWRAATNDPGLYVAPDGTLYGCTVSGTGRVGQFAAYPGDCDVMLSLDWSPRDEDEVTTDELGQAECELRKLAFPLVAARAS